MNIAIVGAGLAGLAAARELRRAGHDVVIFEKSRAIGGRLASRRAEIDGHVIVFDHGAQNIKASASALETVAHEVLSPEHFAPILEPVCLHDGQRILPGDPASNAEPKWSCRGGITALAKALAREIEIRFDTIVASLSESENGVELRGESAVSLGHFDRVILSAPVPQCVQLLHDSDLRGGTNGRVDALRPAAYRNCLSLMLWYRAPLRGGWYALLAQDRTHPLLWLAHENCKGNTPIGTALVAQLGPAWSHEHYADADELIVAAASKWISELLGEAFSTPAWSAVKRWRYAQPDLTVDFDSVNPRGSRVVICGDGLAGGKAHLAFESGLRAARFVTE
jgi:predicted NAD/FAD-dependent oxidoreductase